jgi:hypothetical protein
MAEASFLSRITRHKHYTRIGKHAHSFQRHKASRKNIQANLARCVSVGAPNARRDKPRSPLTCDQHCSPHFCTRNAQPSCFHNRHHAHQTNAPFAAPLLLKNCGCFAHGHAPPPRCTLAPLLPTSPLATHAALLSLCPSPWQHFGRLLLGRRTHTPIHYPRASLAVADRSSTTWARGAPPPTPNDGAHPSGTRGQPPPQRHHPTPALSPAADPARTFCPSGQSAQAHDSHSARNAATDRAKAADRTAPRHSRRSRHTHTQTTTLSSHPPVSTQEGRATESGRHPCGGPPLTRARGTSDRPSSRANRTVRRASPPSATEYPHATRGQAHILDSRASHVASRSLFELAQARTRARTQGDKARAARARTPRTPIARLDRRTNALGPARALVSLTLQPRTRTRTHTRTHGHEHARARTNTHEHARARTRCRRLAGAGGPALPAARKQAHDDNGLWRGVSSDRPSTGSAHTHPLSGSDGGGPRRSLGRHVAVSQGPTPSRAVRVRSGAAVRVPLRAMCRSPHDAGVSSVRCDPISHTV